MRAKIVQIERNTKGKHIFLCISEMQPIFYKVKGTIYWKFRLKGCKGVQYPMNKGFKRPRVLGCGELVVGRGWERLFSNHQPQK